MTKRKIQIQFETQMQMQLKYKYEFDLYILLRRISGANTNIIWQKNLSGEHYWETFQEHGQKRGRSCEQRGDSIMMKHSNNCKTDPIKVYIVQIYQKFTFKPNLRNYLWCIMTDQILYFLYLSGVPEDLQELDWWTGEEEKNIWLADV